VVADWRRGEIAVSRLYFSAELRLLAALSSLALSGPDAKKKIKMAGEIGWPRLLAAGRTHKLLPLIAYNINRLGLERRAEASAGSALGEAYMASLRETEQRRAILRSLLIETHRRDMEVIVLKGSTIAEALYPRPELRPSADIDLLVRKNDFTAIEEMTRELGYREVGAERNIHHSVFVRSDAPRLRVECHRGLWIELRHRYPLEDIWARSLPVELAGEEARTMSCEDLLCYLAFHIASQHYFRAPLLWYHDLCRLVTERGDQIDWDLTNRLADRYHLASVLGLSLLVAFELFGGQTSAPELSVPRPGLLRARLFSLIWRQWRPCEGLDRPARPLELALLALTFDTPADALQWFVRKVRIDLAYEK